MKQLFILTLFLAILSLKWNCSAQKAKINVLSINSNTDDFAPIYFKDGIAITSTRKNSLTENYFESEKDGQLKNLSNIFYFSKQDSLEYSQEIDLDLFNHANRHEGPCTFSKNFDTIYFAGTDYKKGGNSKQKVKIFYSTLKENEWKEPKEFKITPSTHNFSHPSLSKNGEILFFVSDMPNGFGGMDIWYCKKVLGGNWSPPINAGNEINSSEDEVFPFLCERGILYFGSNRPESIGGFDIFHCSFDLKNTPKRLDSPINSLFDDYAYITNDDGKSGYFTSNRKKINGDDIYSFEIETNFEDCVESYVPKFCYTFRDTESNKNEAHLTYVWDFGDGKISRLKTPYHCFDSSGQKIITMGLIDTITGVVSQNVGTYTLDIAEPLDYFFHETNVESENKKVIEILDYKNQNKIKEGIVWKLDDKYFLYQDSVLLKNLEAGEYELNGQISLKDTEFCIQKTIEIPFDQVDGDKLKILANENEQKGISNFVIETINEKAIALGKQPTLILSASEKFIENRQEWISKVKQTIKEEFQTELFVDFHEGSEVYLYID